MTLKQKRFLKGLTQYDLCLKTGISQSRISLFENGYVTPKENEKRRIAKALRCRVVDIFPETKRESWQAKAN